MDVYEDDLRMGRAGVVDFTLTAAGTHTWKGSGDFSYGSGGAVIQLTPSKGSVGDKEFDEDDVEIYRGDRNVLET